MKYLLDTDHCSYIQQKHPEVLSRLEGLPQNAEIVTSVITQGELLAGVELITDQSRKNRLKNLYEHILTLTSEILLVDAQVAQTYAKIFADLRRKGKPIPTNDLWIAATAKAYNLTLVSNDEHFQYIDDLQQENWIKPAEIPENNTTAQHDVE